MKIIKKHLKYIWGGDFIKLNTSLDDSDGIGDDMFLFFYLVYNIVRTITYIPVIPFILIYSIYNEVFQ